MAEFVELSHEFEEGMPGFRLPDDDGGYTEFSASIEPFLTHEETRPKYDGLASFEITELRFQSSIGTYLDSPAHRYPGERDISDICLDEIIHPGVVVDVRGQDPNESVEESVLAEHDGLDGTAVLFNFGWDSYWDTEDYREYPFISERLVDRLVEEDVALVGVDTFNVDDHRNPARPAHTKLLAEDIPIVENLCGLRQVRNGSFRFYAMPIRAVGAVAMPVRAFAEIPDRD